MMLAIYMDDEYNLFRQVAWEIFMRVSQHEKSLTHERIVASAARLVRERGLEATSVNDVMKNAKLTHGGFYRHFTDKNDLLAAALDRSFEDIFGIVDGELGTGRNVAEVMADYQKFYLSDEHMASPGMGCPVTAIGGDVARGSSELKQRFGAGVNRIIDKLGWVMKGSAQQRHTRAMRRFAMMAGAIIIARACDPDTAASVLKACRAED